MDVKNTTVFLTGASSGIGKSMAMMLAREAKKIVLVARRKERLEELATQINEINQHCEVFVFDCDLADEAARTSLIEKTTKEVGVIDILINNAGFGYQHLFETSRWEKQKTMLRLNMEALTHLTYAFLPGMLEQKRGGILNISSTLGLMVTPFMSTYCGTKHYVTAFSEGLRSEVKSKGIVVTQICPGPVKTEFLDVAGNPLGLRPPALMELSSDECAAISLSSLKKGKALVVPGLLMKINMLALKIVPSFLYRFVIGILGGLGRKKVKS